MAEPELEALIAALAEDDDARRLVQRWSIATAALQDYVRSRTGQRLAWAEVARIALRWLERRGHTGA